MRKTVGILLLLIISFTNTAQEKQEKRQKLKIENNVWSGNKFYKGVFQISRDEALSIISVNREAYELMQKGIEQNKIANILALAGGACVGFPIGRSIAGAEDPMWYFAGIGAAFIVIGLPINNSGNRNQHEAIEVYNEEVLSYYKKERFIDRIHFYASAGSLGLRLTF